MIFPILVVFKFPGEDHLSSWYELSIFAEHRHLFAFGVDEVPLIFPADARVRDDIAGSNLLRTEPLLQLFNIGPRRINAISRRIDGPFDLQSDVFLCLHVYLSRLWLIRNFGLNK